jgi:hypothetical protein
MIDRLTKRIIWFVGFLIYIFKDQIVGLVKKDSTCAGDHDDDLK